MGLTLEQIRQQFNIPKSTSDAEVVRFAQKSNISVIDFSGNGAQNTSDVAIGSDITVFYGQQQSDAADDDIYGGMVSLGNTRAQAADDASKETLEQRLASLYGDSYKEATPEKKQEIVKQYIQNILKYKDNKQALEDLKRLVANTPAESEIAQVLMEAIEESGNEELKAALSEDFIAKNGNVERTSPQLSVADVMQNPNLGEIRVVDGKVVAYDKSGKELTDEDGKPLSVASDTLNGITSVEFFNKKTRNGKEMGWVRIKREDGKVIERPARVGEPGFSEKGENYDQRMQRYFALSEEQYNKLSEEEKMALSAKYQKGIRQSAFNEAKNRGMSDKEARAYAENVVIIDFRALCRRSGKTPEELKGIAITLYGLGPEVAEQEVQKYVRESITTEDASTFSEGVVSNIDLAKDPEMQKAVVKGVAEAGKAAGISDEVANAIGNAITSNKFHGRDATIEALRTQYGLSAEQANEYYANLPEETRQQIEDVTLDAISTVQTEVAADVNQSDDVRRAAADLSTEYITYIDDAGLQMQVIQNNIDYITKNADEEMQEYYTNSVAGNAYNYDITNRDDIIRMVQELGTEKTLEILENARKEYELQRTQNEADRAAKQAETESRQQEQQVTSTNTNDNTVTKSTTVSTQKTTSASAQVSSIAKTDGLARAVASESFKSFKVREKEDFIKSLSASDRQDAIQSIVENAQGFELDALMFSSLKNDVLRYLVAHPSPQNNNNLKHLQRYLSPADKAMIVQFEEDSKTGQEKLKEQAQVKAQVQAQENGQDNVDTNQKFKFGILRR